MHRKPVSKKLDKKIFSSTAANVNLRNHVSSTMKRGGIRL